MRRLTAAGMDSRKALTIYGTRSSATPQAVDSLVDYRSEINQVMPRSIVPYTYTADELATLSGIPNLVDLFGPDDVVACSSCQSVLGPPAYLADMLRFLDAQPSETADVTVKDVLLDRRPDLANLDLGCDNTNVALPYIDLVNEVLEALVTPADPEHQLPDDPAHGRVRHVSRGTFAGKRDATPPRAGSSGSCVCGSAGGHEHLEGLVDQVDVGERDVGVVAAEDRGWRGQAGDPRAASFHRSRRRSPTATRRGTAT